jgi:hypothetical protein
MLNASECIVINMHGTRPSDRRHWIDPHAQLRKSQMGRICQACLGRLAAALLRAALQSKCLSSSGTESAVIPGKSVKHLAERCPIGAATFNRGGLSSLYCRCRPLVYKTLRLALDKCVQIHSSGFNWEEELIEL